MVEKPLLIVITGPTGIGKSAAAIRVARHFGTEIISADSRQIYRGLEITTAAPTAEELSEVRHHLVGTLGLENYYSASRFEHDALAILEDIFQRRRVAVVCGGSQMYIDALCKGIDEIPDISEEVRNSVGAVYQYEGWEKVLKHLQTQDPEYYEKVNHNDIRRVTHALEVCWETGSTYTSFCRGEHKERPFRIMKFVLMAPREVIFERINRRVEKMAREGLVEEVRTVAHLRQLNSLNTVGVKEILRYLDREWSLPEALSRLARNTRVYAKKQLTWLARDSDATRIDITLSDPASYIIRAVEISG